ncbi:MAG: hypothetical protein QG575_2058, partial [Euryarchaeota archaeon]|nr:hypothetical protein [Euryarchaeota archaeon]
SLRYVCELSSQTVSQFADECTCLLCTSTPECDGYLIAGEGFRTVLMDEKGRGILVKANFGEGLIVATTVHEFPAADYITCALSQAKPAKL